MFPYSNLFEHQVNTLKLNGSMCFEVLDFEAFQIMNFWIKDAKLLMNLYIFQNLIKSEIWKTSGL